MNGVTLQLSYEGTDKGLWAPYYTTSNMCGKWRELNCVNAFM